jgi:hypothetical protein
MRRPVDHWHGRCTITRPGLPSVNASIGYGGTAVLVTMKLERTPVARSQDAFRE